MNCGPLDTNFDITPTKIYVSAVLACSNRSASKNGFYIKNNGKKLHIRNVIRIFKPEFGFDQEFNFDDTYVYI